MHGEERLRKLNWLCRRGMKELDILLQRFTESCRAELVDGAWPELEELLRTEDDLLWGWLMNPETHQGPYGKLLDEIRHASN